MPELFCCLGLCSPRILLHPAYVNAAPGMAAAIATNWGADWRRHEIARMKTAAGPVKTSYILHFQFLTSGRSSPCSET